MLLGYQQLSAQVPNQSSAVGSIMTIGGSMPADSMGICLIHEHVFLDWSGAEGIDKKTWKNKEAFDIILPHLHAMAKEGVHTFLECTPAYLGRNPRLLLALHEATGVQIVTNTGYYAARKYQHIPQSFYEQTADEVAQIWIDEFRHGIGGTDVRPGFIKIGLDDKDDLTADDKKLIIAAAKTHLVTGLTIVSHTGTDQTAALQLDVLQEQGVTPEAFVWTHAQRGTIAGHTLHASRGAWISLDGLGWVDPRDKNNDSTALYQYVDMLSNLKKANLLHRALISHDAGWYTVGEELQNNYRPYTLIFNLLIPLLKSKGFDQTDLDQLLVQNPKEAYGIRIRSIP